MSDEVGEEQENQEQLESLGRLGWFELGWVGLSWFWVGLDGPHPLIGGNPCLLQEWVK